MRALAVILSIASVLALAPQPVLAQSTTRIFDIELGIPVGELPSDEWVNPACGTNGGPPSIELETFEDYRRCPVEAETGLREIWFIYDNEWEYIARAYRDPVEIARFSANVFYGQPIITSLMIDDDGLVQGYRVITDPKAPDDVRLEAYNLLGIFRTMYSGAPWQCENLPPGERESPVDGVFVKSRCVMASERQFVRIEAHLLRKPGQDYYLNPLQGYFEAFTRLEVYGAEAVSGQVCCPASPPR
jgi:hypothetical protein